MIYAVFLKTMLQVALRLLPLLEGRAERDTDVERPKNHSKIGIVCISEWAKEFNSA